MVSANGRSRDLLVDPLVEALGAGLLPVLMGDVVLDTETGARIVSTEGVFLSVIPLLIARGYEVASVCWLGDTDGILDPDGGTIPRITRANARSVVASLTAGANLDGADRVVRDVTGGMRHRLESALALCRLGVPSWILNGATPGALAKAVAGEAVPATWVESAELAD
jgi:isopentenyl phosphate kinase